MLAATLDDLGLVVEAIELINEGLDDVVVVGSSRSLRSKVPTGSARWWSTLATARSRWCAGPGTSRVDDLVPLAPVGAVLPGGFAIGRRKMKGVVSNGMLCSGRELKLSEDHEGILRLNDGGGCRVGRALTEVLGIEPDVVFDIAVEANRPDAWCIAGVARDLAARLGLPFAIPATSELPRWVARRAADGGSYLRRG